MSIHIVTIPITAEMLNDAFKAVTVYTIPPGSTLLSFDTPKPGGREIHFTCDDGKDDYTMSVGGGRMSSFICPECGTEILDTPTGYITGCPHYPLKRGKKLTDEFFINARARLKFAEDFLKKHGKGKP